MMKRIVYLLLAVMGWQLAAAQMPTTPADYNPDGKRNFERAIAVFETFHVPAGSNAALGIKGWKRQGAIYYDSVGIDTGLYVLGSGGVFQKYATAASVNIKLNISDTTGKWVNNILRNATGDSILYYINNTRYAIKDSTGTLDIYNQKENNQAASFWISNTGRFGKKREPTGVIHQDYFTGSGFGSLYDTSVTNVTRTFNGFYLKDSVKAAGEGSINNYITVTAPTGRSKWVQEVKWLSTRKNLQDYGIGIGLRSTNSFFSPDFFVHFVWRNNLGQNGSAQLYLDNLSPGSPSFITHDTVGTNIGDTMISRVEYNDGLIAIKYTNQTTSETVDTSYYYGTSVAGTYQAPNTAKFVLRFFGGVHQIFSWTISSEERKGSVLFLGNSITYGYTASVFDSTFPAQIFSQRWMYEKSGGPGDRTADVITKLAEIVALDPSYIVYSMGVNDKQSGVSAATFGANTRRIMDTLTLHHIPVIILSLSPLNSSSVVAFNDTLQNIAAHYGFKYVNDFDSLRNGGTSWNSSYTTDNVHPNTLGHTIIARILAREAPEILGDTAIAVDRLLYKEDIPYMVAYDEEDGIFKVTNRDVPGIDNANVGTGYSLLKPASQEVKKLFADYGVTIDSTSNANSITFKLDTATVFQHIRATIPAGGSSGRFGVSGEDTRSTAARSYSFASQNFILDSVDLYRWKTSISGGRVMQAGIANGNNYFRVGDLDINGNFTWLDVDDDTRSIDLHADSVRTIRTANVKTIADSAGWYMKIRNKLTGVEADAWWPAPGAGGSGITIGSTTVTGATNGYLLYNNSGVVGHLDPGSLSGAITIGTSVITSGTNTRILYNNSGVVGEYTLTGSGTVVAMQNSPTLTTPRIANAGYIADENGNEQLIFNTTASAVNEISITNKATGAAPIIASSGETNVGLDIATKGTGNMKFFTNGLERLSLLGSPISGKAQINFGGTSANLDYGVTSANTFTFTAASFATVTTGAQYFSSNSAATLTLYNGTVNAGAVSAANSTLQTKSFATGYVAKTGTYTATISDHTIECTANTFTVTLPTAVSINGREYTVVNTGAGTITIATTSSQNFININGTPNTLTLAAVGSGALTSVTVKSNGAHWVVTSRMVSP